MQNMNVTYIMMLLRISYYLHLIVGFWRFLDRFVGTICVVSWLQHVNNVMLVCINDRKASISNNTCSILIVACLVAHQVNDDFNEEVCVNKNRQKGIHVYVLY